MINTIKMDFTRFFMYKKSYIYVLSLSVLFPAFSIFILFIVSNSMGESFVCTFNEFMMYQVMDAFYVAVMITDFLHSEISEGSLRNKIIAGKNRKKVLLSYCTVFSIISTVMIILSIITTALCSMIVKASFDIGTINEFITMIVIQIFANIAITVFLTVVFCVFSTNKASIVLPTLITAISKVFTLYIFEKLYPESGIPAVTGIKLEILNFFDKYVPFTYLLSEPHSGLTTSSISCLLFIVISFIIGCFVFERIDLK